MTSENMFEDYSLLKAHIRDLSPAELMLLINKKASFYELLRVTIIDLYLRHIIDIHKKEKYLEDHKKNVTFHFIVPGKRFQNYQPRLHERKLINYLKEEEGLPFVLILQKLFPSLRSHRIFYNHHLRAQLVKKQLIGNIFFYRYFDIFQKTKKSKAIFHLMKAIRAEVFENLDDWIKNNPDVLIELINKLDNHCITDNYLIRNIIIWANSKNMKFDPSKLRQKGKSYIADYIIALHENPASVINIFDIEWNRSIPVYDEYTSSNDIHYQAIQYALQSDIQFHN